MIERIIKKSKAKDPTVKPFMVRNHLWVFLNCLIENPAFDSQVRALPGVEAVDEGGWPTPRALNASPSRLAPLSPASHALCSPAPPTRPPGASTPLV